jgi:hypothetical protein
MLAALSIAHGQPARAQSRTDFAFKGIAHVSWWFDEYGYPDATRSRDALAATGANWAAVLVTWYQDTARSTTIAPRILENKTPTDAVVQQAVMELHDHGLRVMLKPHVDPWNGQWRGEIDPSNPDAWFASYTAFIVKYAEMAESLGVEALAVGTELKTVSGASNRQRWVAVIDAVRRVYRGTLTYAANAAAPGDEFTSVSFWDRLDVIGLDAYFPLTDLSNPTVDQLVSAWSSNRFGENNFAAVMNFASAWQKPLIFTEIGYKSTDRANREPWNFGLTGAVDMGEQRDCYEAAFTVWGPQSSWMRGFFWWAWPVPPPAEGDSDYTPRGKPAETVLRTWNMDTTTPDFTLSMSRSHQRMPRMASATLLVSIERANGFTGSVALDVQHLPPGVTARFESPTASGATSTLTLTTTRDIALATSTIEIVGTSGAVRRSTFVTLTLTSRRPS